MAGRQPGGVKRCAHRALRGVEVQGEARVVVGLAEPLHLVEVGPHEGRVEIANNLVGQGFLPAHQRDAGREALQVPGEVPDERLVEVVDVEDQVSRAVHVGAEVLRMQIALDPDPAGPLVGPSVLALGNVGVEDTGASAVERERVSGHLPELGAEGVGVGLHQIFEGLHQAIDDERLPL